MLSRISVVCTAMHHTARHATLEHVLLTSSQKFLALHQRCSVVCHSAMLADGCSPNACDRHTTTLRKLRHADFTPVPTVGRYHHGGTTRGVADSHTSLCPQEATLAMQTSHYFGAVCSGVGASPGEPCPSQRVAFCTDPANASCNMTRTLSRTLEIPRPVSVLQHGIACCPRHPCAHEDTRL